MALTEREMLARERRRVRELVQRAKVAGRTLGQESEVAERMWQEAIDAYRELKRMERENA